MLPLLVLAAFITVFASIIWFAVKQQQQVNARLAAFAARLGFQVSAEKSARGLGAQILGQQHGREVRFWSYVTGSGKSRRTWAAVSVRPRGDGGLSFEIRRQNWTSKLVEMFGTKEITVGDAAFDAMWFVRTNQPEFFTAALVPAIQQKFMAQPKTPREGAYELKQGRVQFSEGGGFASEEVINRLEAKLPLLHDLADVAEVAGRVGN